MQNIMLSTQCDAIFQEQQDWLPWAHTLSNHTRPQDIVPTPWDSIRHSTDPAEAQSKSLLFRSIGGQTNKKVLHTLRNRFERKSQEIQGRTCKMKTITDAKLGQKLDTPIEPHRIKLNYLLKLKHTELKMKDTHYLRKHPQPHDQCQFHYPNFPNKLRLKKKNNLRLRFNSLKVQPAYNIDTERSIFSEYLNSRLNEVRKETTRSNIKEQISQKAQKKQQIKRLQVTRKGHLHAFLKNGSLVRRKLKAMQRECLTVTNRLGVNI